jgi:hypothetical protein
MPIRDILWSNPEWFRVSIGDVESLSQSIKKQGLQVPILVTEDLLVLDGARRITAYMSLGRKEIPIVVTNDWDRIIGHLEHTRAAEAAGLPFEYMSWEDLDTLWRLGITPLYKSTKIAKMVKAVAARRRGKAPEQKTERGDVAVNSALGRAFAMDQAVVKALRDSFAALRGIEEKYTPTDDQSKALRTIVRQVEVKNPGGKFTGIYGLRNLLREFSKGEIPLDQAADVLEMRELAGRRPKDQVRGWERRRRDHPPTDDQVIANFCRVISQFGEESLRFEDFEPSLNTEPLIGQIRTTVNRLNALRRRLERATQSTEGEQDS